MHKATGGISGDVDSFDSGFFPTARLSSSYKSQAGAPELEKLRAAKPHIKMLA